MTYTPELTDWLASLALTLGVELSVLTLLLRHRAPWRRILVAGTVATALTHPQLWFVWHRLFEDWTTYVMVAETFIVLVEGGVIALLLRKYIDWRWALLGSFLANLASFCAGRALRVLSLL